jgi:hypothetical protein
MASSDIGEIVSFVHSVIDRVIPDPAAAAEAKLKTTELAQKGDLDELHFMVEDKASARTRELAMLQAGHKDYITPVLAIGITLGFFCLLAATFFIPIQPSMVSVAQILIGTLGTAWVAVVSYYFGTSSGERTMNVSLAANGYDKNATKTPPAKK